MSLGVVTREPIPSPHGPGQPRQATGLRPGAGVARARRPWEATRIAAASATTAAGAHQNRTCTPVARGATCTDVLSLPPK